MASYRRTLSMEDLVNASDDEMDNLLLEDRNQDEIVHHEHPGLSSNNRRFENSNSNTSAGGNNDSAPILELGGDGDNNEDLEIKPTMPRSKSVRFQEPETSQRGGAGGDVKLNYVKVQVDQATGIMKDNLARLMEREASLESMSERADQMLYSSDIYHQSSEMLRRKMRWRQVRTRLFLSAVGVICVCLILIPFITKFV